MKTSHSAAVAAVVLCTACLCAPRADAANDPLIPVGSLSAYPTIVRTGTYPTLTWAVTYSTDFKGGVNRDPDGTMTTKEELQIDIAIVGASNQVGTTSGGNPVYGQIESNVRVGSSSSYTTFFQDVQTVIDPTVSYFTQVVPASTVIDFRARESTGSTWLTYRSTETLTSNVITLINGETPPSTVTKKVESYLAPFLTNSGTVKLGPMEVLVLYELNETTTSKPGFTNQDLVVLVTFSRPKNNNGHGNNLDGVDVSNPGQGGGGPNGGIDPSGIVDDEGKAVKP